MPHANIERLAFQDPLTGLANPLALRRRLEKSMLKHQSSGKWICLCTLDIDGFGRTNDIFGELVANKLLKKFSERLLYTFSEADTVARVRDDQFAAFFENIESEADGTVIGNRLMASLKQPFDASEFRISVSVCAGLSFYRADGVTAEELLAKSEEALLHAKQLGNKRFHILP